MDQPLAFIVEDDEDSSNLFGHILEFIGFKTEKYRRGGQAIEMLKKSIPHLVLLDLMLADQVSGMEVLAHIRKDERLVDTIVIIVTAYPRNLGDLEDEADLVLVKPISPRQLKDFVSRLCVPKFNIDLMNNAAFDPVTKLPNRALYTDRLQQAIKRSKRNSQYYFATLFFKLELSSKDSEPLTQKTIDLILLESVNRLRSNFRQIDTFARVDNHEFAILLEDINDHSDVDIVIEKIKKHLDSPFVIEDTTINVVVDYKPFNLHEAGELLESLLEGSKLE
jgi:diguanylate cyclase (GGDEF)-like protein